MQLAHDGRQSHIDLSDGNAPIAASVVHYEGQAFTQNGWVPVSPHRALGIEEMPALVDSFRRAAARAREAGFDGVELRGADRVGVRVSPSGTWGAISDSDPQATFGAFAKTLNAYGLAYLHIIEPRVSGVETVREGQPPIASAYLRKIFTGPITAAGGFDRGGAEAILEKGDADLVAFGRFFTSNPDLPERLRRDLPLTPYVREGFWGGGERNYIDFTAYDAAVAA